ncbi:GmrSD restriction endonuclease domain-containing protein [Halosimplex marinum]|uniref:GmrSD restriction endonuclease domain-containing protein n=1 Tax=Halosimplex marinum TaxID=3396620 RepID=UPI003F560C54
MPEIGKLVDKVEANEIVLPEFQREYVWGKDQAKELMKSLYKEYPIGSLLIWETENPPEIKNDAVDREQYGLFKVLLDGQQRLTVLYLLIKDDIPPYYTSDDIQTDPRNLYFNLDSGEFKYENKSTRDNPEWVKVTDCFDDDVSIFEIAKETTEDEAEVGAKAEEYNRELKRISKITSLQMPKEELGKSADVHQAINLFDKVNSQGTDLGDAELALAHMSAQWPYIRREMKETQAMMAEEGYDFDLDFYVKCMIAVVTGGMTYERVYDTDKETLVESWELVDEVLNYLTSFLENEAQIPDSSYINTRAVLIPLIKYLSDNDVRMTRQEKDAFLKWLYSAMMWRRYSRSTDTTLEKDLSLLGGPNPVEDLMEEIKDDRGRIEVQPSDLEGRGKSSKHFYNMVRILSRNNNPSDWATGEPLRGSYELESHHIFPKSQLYGTLYDSNNHMGRKRVNEIANRAFVTSRGNSEIFTSLPKDYFPGVKEDHPEIFDKQYIPENPEFWKLENYEKFLSRRRELLADAINEFIQSFETPEGPDKPSLEALIGKGENHRIEFKETLLYDVYRDQPNADLKQEAVKEIASFANAEGGTLIIGVDDDGDIKGLDRDLKLMDDKDDFEVTLSQEISSRLGDATASLYTQIEFREIEGETVCTVSVEPSSDPVYFEDDEFIVRQGSSARPLSIQDANQYIQENWA